MIASISPHAPPVQAVVRPLRIARDDPKDTSRLSLSLSLSRFERPRIRHAAPLARRIKIIATPLW